MTTRARRLRPVVLAVLSAASLSGCYWDPYTGYVYPCDAYSGCYYPSYYYPSYYYPSYYYSPCYYPPGPAGWRSPLPSAPGAASGPVSQQKLPPPPPGPPNP